MCCLRSRSWKPEMKMSAQLGLSGAWEWGSSWSSPLSLASAWLSCPCSYSHHLPSVLICLFGWPPVRRTPAAVDPVLPQWPYCNYYMDKDSFELRFLCYSAQAAVAECYRSDGLKHRNYVRVILKGRSHRSECQPVWGLVRAPFLAYRQLVSYWEKEKRPH